MIRVDRIRAGIAVILGVAVLAGILRFIGSGMMIMIVLSGSMTPLMLPGDVIVVAPENPDNVDIGDVVVFQHPDMDDRMVITHRVIDIDEETGAYSTKGDANEDPDPFSISEDNVIGKPVFLIPLVGFASEMKKQIFLLMVILPSLALILLEARKTMRSFYTARRSAQDSPVPKGQFISVRYSRFFLLLSISLIPFLVLTAPSLCAMQGYNPAPDSPVQQGQHVTVEGVGLVPEVYLVSTPGAGEVPAYGVLQPGETVSIPVSGTDPRQTVARSPYILPGFWFVGLAGLDPYLPALCLAILPGSFLTLALCPLWAEKKFVKLRRKRRLVERVLES